MYFYLFSDNVRVKQYLEGYISERKILLKYGPKLIGLPGSMYLYLRSLLKSYVLIGLSIIGKENIINKNKYSLLNHEQILEAKKIIEKIGNQVVPGWE